MGKLLHATLLAISALALSKAASAADLPRWSAPPVSPIYNWTGMYIGINLGYGLAQHRNTNSDGIIGGGQIGYNWQADQWVFGAEGDFQGSGQKADGTFYDPVAPTTISFGNKLEWFGTFRARMGYAFDCWLPYLAGGLAYGRIGLSATSNVAGVTTGFNDSRTYEGWTIGGGLEWAFANNWNARVEYLYIDLGDGPNVDVAPAGATVVSAKLTDNIVRVGVNYRFW